MSARSMVFSSIRIIGVKGLASVQFGVYVRSPADTGSATSVFVAGPAQRSSRIFPAGESSSALYRMRERRPQPHVVLQGGVRAEVTPLGQALG